MTIGGRSCITRRWGTRITRRWGTSTKPTPPSLPCPHIRWLLPILLSKHNSQLPAKKNPTIHVTFGLCSIIRFYKLDKTKTTRFPRIIIPWQVNVLDSSKLLKWPANIFWPAIMAKITNKKASGQISPTSTTISASWARAPSSAAVPTTTPPWRRRRRRCVTPSSHCLRSKNVQSDGWAVLCFWLLGVLLFTWLRIKKE